MAEGPLSSTLVDDFLTCQICFEVFKDPRILPCLHTFCLECLIKLQNGSKSNVLKCPMCRSNISVPKTGISDLKINFYINNLIDLVQTKDVDSPVKLCSFCTAKGEISTALYRCLECQDSLCQTCADRHNFTRLTLKHKVVNLAEVRSGNYDGHMRSMQEVQCQTHKNEDVRYFCETCDLPVCRDCVLLSHKTHSCVTVEEALKGKLGSIQNLISDLDIFLKSYTDEEKDLETKLSKVEEKEKEETAVVTSLTNQTIAKIRSEETKTREKLGKLYERPKEKLREKVIESRKKAEPIKESLKFCKSILRNGKAIEILTLQELLQKRLIELQSTSPLATSPMPDFTTPSVKLNPKFGNDLDMFHFTDTTIFLKENPPTRAIVQCTENPQKEISTLKTQRQFSCLHFIRKINCSSPEYKNPKLTSISWINGSTFAVTDNNNDIVRVFDTSGSALRSISVANPITLAYCSNSLVCFSATHLHLITATGDVSTKAVSKGYSIYPVVAKGEHFLAGGIEKGKIIEYSGIKAVNTINLRHSNGNDINVSAFSLSVNSQDDIVVSNKCNGTILVFKKNGVLKKSFNCEDKTGYMESWQPGAITVDMYDNIFVACYEGSKMFVLSSKDKKVTESEFQKKIVHPRSIALSNDELLVSGYGGSVCLFKVKYTDYTSVGTMV